MFSMECEECGHEMPPGPHTICAGCERRNEEIERALEDRRDREYWEEIEE